MENQKIIAVICANEETFQKFLRFQMNDRNLHYVKISSELHARGLTLDGYTHLHDVSEIKDYNKLIHAVKTRLKP